MNDISPVPSEPVVVVPITPEISNPEEKKLKSLSSKAEGLLIFQTIFLIASGIIFGPLLFAHGEGLGWALLILGIPLLLAILVLGTCGVVGLAISIKLLKSKVTTIFSFTSFFVSFLCIIAFLIGLVAFILPIVYSNMKITQQENDTKKAEVKKSDFFHDRYMVLTEQFKEQQKAYSYANGHVQIGVEDTGERFPGKEKIILLGFRRDSTSNTTHVYYWNSENDIAKGKMVRIVLPDEAIFKASYSCDGPYQDCVVNYPKMMPYSEYFYAKVYLGDRLLNDDFTPDEQAIAMGGEKSIYAASALNSYYQSYTERFKYPQKVLNASLSGGQIEQVYVPVENTNTTPAKDGSVDIDIFSKPYYGLSLKGSFYGYSSDKLTKITNYLNQNIVNKNVQIIMPSYDEFRTSNRNLGSNSEYRLNVQINADMHVMGQTQSLYDVLKKL